MHRRRLATCSPGRWAQQGSHAAAARGAGEGSADRTPQRHSPKNPDLTGPSCQGTSPGTSLRTRAGTGAVAALLEKTRGLSRGARIFRIIHGKFVNVREVATREPSRAARMHRRGQQQSSHDQRFERSLSVHRGGSGIAAHTVPQAVDSASLVYAATFGNQWLSCLRLQLGSCFCCCCCKCR